MPQNPRMTALYAHKRAVSDATNMSQLGADPHDFCCSWQVGGASKNMLKRSEESYIQPYPYIFCLTREEIYHVHDNNMQNKGSRREESYVLFNDAMESII